MGRERAAKYAYLKTASFLSKSKELASIDKVEYILIKILEEETNSLILRITAYILGRTAKKEIAKKIIAILQKAELSERRQHCATALGLLRATEAVIPLIGSLSDEANNVRGSAATALGRIGSEQAVMPLIEMLHDEDRINRGSAATALGQIGSEQAVEPLIECLKDEANDVRGSAATALGRIGSEQAVAPLIECLKDEANNVRGSAATALGQIGSEQAVAPLIECLKDKASHVQLNVATALGRISSETPIPNILDVINVLVDLVEDELVGKAESSLRQLLHASFRSGNLKTVHDSIDLLKYKLSNLNEFFVPYLIAIEYLEFNRNPAVIERQHLEMREAVLLLVNAFDEGYSKE